MNIFELMEPIDWTIPLIVILLTCIIIGVMVLWQNHRSRTNQMLAAMQFVVAWWIIASLMMTHTSDYDTAMFWDLALWFGAAFIPSTTAHFVLRFTKVLPPGKTIYLWGFHIVAAISLPFVLWEQASIGLIEAAFTGTFDGPSSGPVYSAYAVFLIGTIYLSIFFLWRRFATVHNRIEKHQALLIAIGMTVPGVGGPIFSMVLPILGYDVNLPGGLFVFVMSLAMGYAIIRYRMFEIEAVTEEATTSEPEFTLVPGTTYLIKERGLGNTYGIFRSAVSTRPGLCLTTYFPAKLRSDYRLKKTPIVWISETDADEQQVGPHRLDFEILYTIESFVKDNSKTTVLIDDLGYLASMNGFDKTLGFLRSVIDLAAVNDVTLLIPIHPQAFTEAEMTRFTSIFDEVLDLGDRPQELAAGTIHLSLNTALFDEGGDPEELAAMATALRDGGIVPSYSYYIAEDRPERATDLVRNLGDRVLCVTKTFPDKFRTRHRLPEAKIHWLTTSRKGGEATLDPRRLEFEVTHVIAEFLRARQGVVLIEGLDLLVMENKVEEVADFLKTIIDIASVNQGIIVASHAPAGIPAPALALLETRFDVVRYPSAEGA